RPRFRFRRLAAGHGSRNRRGGIHPAALDLVDTLGAQDLLNTADRVALEVQQVTNAPQQVKVLRPVVASPAAPLHGLDLRELLFPEPEDVLGNVELFRDLADGPERLG